MARKKQKKMDDGTTLFIRNVPIKVADRIRRHAREKRQNIAGVIIELVEFAGNSNYFTDENNH